MQGPRAEHANYHGGKNGGHDEVWRDSLGHDVLIPGLGLRHDDFGELAWGAFRRLDPTRYAEEDE